MKICYGIHFKERSRILNKANFFLDKQKKIKTQSGKFLSTFLIIFLAGYLFFFTSSLFMPAPKAEVSATSIGTTISGADRNFTLLSWDYCKKQRAMQIVLELSDNSIDGIKELEYLAVEKTKGNLDCEVYINEKDFAVIFIKNIPRKWSEISLHIDIPKTDEREAVTLKMYTTKDTVANVDKITKKDKNEFYKTAIETQIANFKKEIDDKEKEIKNKENKLVEADEKIKDKEEKQAFETSEEKEKSNRIIQQIVGEKEKINTEIADLKAEISELEAKIEMQESKKESL